MNGFQLEMNFEHSDNRLRDCLGNGIFTLLIEHASPTRQTDPAIAAKRLEALEFAALDAGEMPVGLAITDRFNPVDSVRAVEYAATLSSATRNRHLVYLSGRDTSPGEMKALLTIAANAGVANVVPVSGDRMPGENAKATRQRSFAESVCTIREASAGEHEFFTGCVVNPYKYAPLPLLGQYFKLVKKVNLGASFVVTQAGFDMVKLQEVRRYLSLRQLYIPSLARLILLTPERMDQIIRGAYPGVNISPDFQELLRKELRFSSQQFEAAQWRRLELQAAGCRFLGFSGVQLAGVDTPEKLKTATRRINEAMKEFSSFEQWLEEYEFYLGRADLTAYANGFQLFGKHLSPEAPETAPIPSDYRREPLSWREKRGFAVRKFFFPDADRMPAGSRRLLKKLLAGCRGCSRCRLPETFFVCTEKCPKRLANGPCGGASARGLCELGTDECIFNSVTALAEAHGGIDRLENDYLEQAISEVKK